MAADVEFANIINRFVSRMTPMRFLAPCTAAICSLAIATLVAAAPARAQDDGKSFDQKFFGSVLHSLGLENGDQGPGIDYRERGPLVIPPTKTLPPPENSDAAAKNPAWPKDPDITRRREAAKRERERNISDEREREQNPLRPDQITPGGTPTYVAGRDDGFRGTPDGSANPLKPNELGYTGGLLKKMFGKGDSEVKRFTGEPARVDLTAPPAGYQTPSPAQPYGPAGAEATKVTNDYETRGEVKTGR
jgi:hypothetical protein